MLFKLPTCGQVGVGVAYLSAIYKMFYVLSLLFMVNYRRLVCGGFVSLSLMLIFKWCPG